jgi:hypothetical protein
MCLECQGWTKREVYAWMRSRILEHGFTITMVDPDGPASPPFAYTVGLSRVDHPEIICFNMCPACAERALTPLARAVLDLEVRLSEGAEVDHYFGPEATGAQLLEFPDSSTHLFDANNFYRRAGGPPVPALQLLWPDYVPLLHGLGR